MSEVYRHPTEATTDTHRVQMAIYLMPVLPGFEAQQSVKAIASSADVEYGITKKTLRSADCASVERTGGPTESREVADPKTVAKLFDATSEPIGEGLIPERCRECPFSNFEKRTLIRNRPTQGCIILGARRDLIEKTSSNPLQT